MRRFIFSMLIFLLLCAPAVEAGLPAGQAGKKPAPAPGPSAAEQQAFTEKYWQAVDGGDLEFSKFSDEVTNHGTLDEVHMLDHLKKGKAADGGERKGFRGDPNDPGPQDWSDYNIKTDKDGNVTGFEEKDFEAKDTDKDGEISDAERAEWDKKKQEENAQNGGAPGEVDTPPDWDDSPHDGEPDADFELDCWRCKKGELHECVDGAPGPCTGDPCDVGQQCVEHPETHGKQSLICHNCIPTETIVRFCEDKGYSSDPACDGGCPRALCVPLDIDIESGKVVPSMQTRTKGSTQRCYACMKVDTIEITYIVIIIETPYARYVLDKSNSGGHFKPSSVMALAKVDSTTGMIKNTFGELKQASNFLGSFNAGMGLPGLAGTGRVNMDQMTSLLTSGLNSAGGYTADCFGNVAKEARLPDGQAQAETAAPTDPKDKSKKEKKNPKQKKDEGLSEEQLKAADKNGNPAVSGPVVACGEEDGNKVLKIYSAGGALVDTITQQALKLNPNIILEKMGLAQQLSDMFVAKSGFDFAGYVEKFTGLPLKQIQSTAAQIAQIKGQADQLAGAAAKKKKKAKAEELPPVLPNDPLYDEGPGKVKKKMLGILGSSKAPPVNPMGSAIKTGLEAIEARKAEEIDIKDQWSLQKIGFTAWDDPNSAWNVVDANQKNIVVAVIDSGLDFSHEDAPQYLWTNPKEVVGNGIDDDNNGFVDDIHGWNFLNENHDFTDVRGHGTFVTGIIAAKYNNGAGIAGINPGAVIMPIKVADEEGVTDSLAIYRAINYAVDHGAKVINVSLGSKAISKLEQQAVERAHAMGALVVIAAGNSNESLVAFGPSSAKHALAVGQIDYSPPDGEAGGVRSTVSNWGPNLGLVAPGEQIYSLCSKDNKHVLPSIRKTGYYKQDGTSFATPMVAATASLLWAKNPALTNEQVADIILATATDMGDSGWDGMTGAGLLNAAAALRADTSEKLTVMITNIRTNRDPRGKVVSVDVYGTVRGTFKEYTVEAGKGKNATRFNAVAGPYREGSDYQHITRLIVQDVLRGSDEWILRIRAVDNNGREHIASTPFTLPE